ncbi:hypothetical protein H1R17_02945 [Flavobacterium sp. xlx-214]|uniref:hypothetical protein n=1 Tax=unclassified Flavobacterium TaxID=196869 RepID=UPI0013CF52FD|nr:MULTISPECIES: hypothetical protein [unclassified Flavobacterium]MBA5793328.1 hypothetical protein [Flavobacterium sp. xlx-221]QMI84109.1 hypothetical protein H1R17_02945 [Flavobacterium sp. xlx-214]
MKKIALLLTLALTFSCGVLKKDKDGYNGTWILQNKSGGFTGRTTQPDQEVKLVIKNDKIKYFENGKLVSEDVFKVEKAKVIQSTEPQDVIVSKKLMKESISVQGDTLIISQQCYDCYTFMYTRK